MAQARFYSSVAAKTALVGTINASGTTLVVAAATGFPSSLPFTLILERDTANEEVVTVTAVSGTTLTISRAQDGTTGVTHTTGAVVEHGVSARDFSEPQAHIAATGSVHGLAGSIVGTTDTQTLAGKTLTSPVVTGTWAVDATGLAQIQKPFGIFNDTLGTFLATNGAWNLATLATVTAKSTTLGGGSLSRGTASVTGTWRVSFNLVAPGGTGPWAVMIRKNAAGVSSAGTEVATQANGTVTGVGNAMNCSGLIQLNAGDYVEGFFWNGSGANQTIVNTTYDAMLLCMEYVSAP